MKKRFNVAGPCIPEEHYMLHFPEKLQEVFDLIEEKTYFVIHAARQSGKTTLLLQLTKKLNSEGNYYALYCSLEGLQKVTNNKEGIPEIVRTIQNAIKTTSSLPHKDSFAKEANYLDYTNVLKTELSLYCQLLDKPLVIFFDEADCLSEDTLITFLRQIRNGYNTRSLAPFAHSLALVGMRNIRDYKAKIRPDSETLGSASPFNIVTESLTIKSFTIEDIEQLYNQHTEATGQVFEKEAIQRVYEQTNGQPWLVNAIAREIVVKLLNNDYNKPVTPELVDSAIQNIILRRDTHIDSLLERLKEERVRKVIEPIITGKEYEIDFTDDDTHYCLDLGLIKDQNRVLKPSNRIYTEVIIRALNHNMQIYLQTKVTQSWLDKDGNLDMDSLLKGFQTFWRENAGIWEEKYQYKEAAPHLVLQAFLQRVINGGGNIQREYASNRGRLDLCIFYNGKKYPIEIKIRYSNKTYEEGVQQLSQYMDELDCSKGWLVVFDKRKSISWSKKLFTKSKKADSKEIILVGC